MPENVPTYPGWVLFDKRSASIAVPNRESTWLETLEKEIEKFRDLSFEEKIKEKDKEKPIMTFLKSNSCQVTIGTSGAFKFAALT